MAATIDFTRLVQEMTSAFKMAPATLQDAFAKQAAFGEKLSKIAFDAAERSCDLQAKMSRETLSKLSELTRARSDVSDYSKAASDLAAQGGEMASDTMAAFAEIAKKAQLETVELMISATKTLQDSAGAAVKSAAADVVSAMAPKAAAAAK